MYIASSLNLIRTPRALVEFPKSKTETKGL